ncbi:MAG: ribonuclease H [Gemmatimonadales bacterium]
MNFDLFGDDSPPPRGRKTSSSASPRPVARKSAASRRIAEDGAIVAIYADESCLGNGREGSNPGGAGGVIELMDSGILVRWDYWVSEPATTNNRMALQSVIEAFGELSRMERLFRVVFTSDSKYIVEGMRSWVAGWIARGWRRKAGPIENLSLWKEAVRATEPFECQWNWVRGHNGQPQNEYANDLATRAAAEQSNSGGLRASEFDSWLAESEGRKGFSETAPFPEAGTFKPSPRVWTI